MQGVEVRVAGPHVAHGGGDHAAFAEGGVPDHRLMHVGAAELRLGEGAREHVHMVGATAHAAVEFVIGVQPLGGQALHDRVGGVAGLEREDVLGAVAGAEALALDLLLGVDERDGLAGLVVDGDALAEGGAAQPQQIISLKLSQPVKALFAAWTLTRPPPFMTNSVKESFIAVPHSGPL